jgi:hypothetical protein
MFKQSICVAVIAVLASISSTQAAGFTDVTGLDGGGWTVDYQYHVVDQALNGNTNFYNTDNSAAINATIAAGGLHIARVAYYMELSGATNGNDVNGHAFVSFDTISSNANQLGVPTTQSGEFYQQNVAHMDVISNVPGVQTGTNLPGGNIEFWPSNYGQGLNGASPPNGDPNLFDFGDSGGDKSNGFGSMQIHNHALTTPDIHTGNTGQTIIAFNQWGAGGGNDLGIGNQAGPYSAGQTNPDWTFRSNVGQYNGGVTDIQVLVQLVPEPSSFILCGLGAVGLLVTACRRRRT